MNPEDKIREVVNEHSRDLTQFKKDLKDIKLVLGYYEKKEHFDIFFKTLESQGVTKEELAQRPDLLKLAMGSLRRMK